MNLECMFGNMCKTQGPAGATCRSQEACGAHLLRGWLLISWFGGLDQSGWVHQVWACPWTGTGLWVRFSPDAKFWTRPGSSSLRFGSGPKFRTELQHPYCYRSLVFLIVPLLRKDPIVLPFRIDCHRPVYKPAFSLEVKP